MRRLPVFLATSALLLLPLLSAPKPVRGQTIVAGALAGLSSAEIPPDERNRGGMAGAFLQIDAWEHVGIRAEGGWAQSAYWQYPSCGTLPDLSSAVLSMDAEYLEASAVARLSWSTSRLPLAGTQVGAVLFGGGWMGLHVGDDDRGSDPEGRDHGSLFGIGLTVQQDRIFAQVDLRSSQGKVEFWGDGPTRDDRQLVMSVGYQLK